MLIIVTAFVFDTVVFLFFELWWNYYEKSDNRRVYPGHCK